MHDTVNTLAGLGERPRVFKIRSMDRHLGRGGYVSGCSSGKNGTALPGLG